MINLINPKSPFLQEDAVMPPLGLFYLSAVLNKEGIENRIIDLGLGDELPDSGFNYVTGTTPQLSEMLKLRGGYCVAGGTHASIQPESLKGFSLVVQGEGEEVIADIARNKPRGLLRAPRIRDLDSIPFPERSRSKEYSYTINGIPATTMITSRGCNGQCSFCCKAVMNRGIFLRSVDNILREIEELKSMGWKAVMFYDDSIAIVKSRLMELCKGINGLTWRSFVRSDQVSQEMMDAMADAGCYEVLIGIESGSNQILKNIRKYETVDQHESAIAMAKRAGIKVKALMIAGLPGETWETIEESRQFIERNKPDSLDVTILQVYPGCDIAVNPSNYSLTYEDPTWYKGRNDEYVSTVSTPELTQEDVVKARDILVKEFNK